MKGDGLGFNFALFNIDFVTAEDDGDVFANADEVTMPVRNVFVRDTGSDVKHDYSTLAINVIAVS